MEALRTCEICAGGDVPAELTGVIGDGGLNVADRYVGPGAWWIASQLAHPVRFEDGWFRTKATCHGTGPDELAFRQRPDGNGIEARCLAGVCCAELATDALGAQIGWPLRFAYEPLAEPVGGGWRPTDWPWRSIAWYAAGLLAFLAPLLLGHDLEAGILGFIGFNVGSLLMDRILRPRRVRRYRR